MSALLNLEANDNAEERAVAAEIKDRLSQELVIALVGPIGSGVTTAGEHLKESLSNRFKYDVAPLIKVSDFIRVEARRVDKTAPDKVTALSKYVYEMQTIGNLLREKFGGNYLMEKAVEKIVEYRTSRGGYKNQILIPGRRAYIIDSIKNVEELSLLRQIYGRTLCVFGVFAPDSIRHSRLKDNGVQETEIRRIVDRDQGEVATFGQMTRKVFVKSDFFICNDEKEQELKRKLDRFLDLIFSFGIHTPTNSESAMYKADSVAASSACMSRQVGAAILSKNAELIAVGWNDVPKYLGGLYVEDDQSLWDAQLNKVDDKDHRCFKWGGKICHNETRRNGILDKIAQQIHQSKMTKANFSVLDIRNALSGTDVDSLTEFSRSIHAEMEAILSVAREGRHSLAGATLYTTTYPCHNCARHIVASGIEKVIYIEPYLKSLATTLHSDAVTEDPNEKGKVFFRQYDGVSPSVFSKLFRSERERKQKGRVSQGSAVDVLPVFQIPLDGPTEYESKIIADLSQKEHS